MYPIRCTHGHVRDPSGSYATRWQERESFPAEGVLRDLKTAPDPHIPHVLARYAVLRFWILATEATPPVVLDHARSAALAHLDHCVEAGPGTAGLRSVIETPEPLERASETLRAAAAAADSEGHVAGAFSLLRAAYVAARRRLDYGVAAANARALAAFVGRHGDTVGAARWARRADRLGRRAEGWRPPSAN